MRAARPLLVAGVVVPWAVAAGCYHPQALDGRALLGELRRSDEAPGRGPATGGSATLDEDRAVAVALVANRSLRALRLERGVAAGEIIAAGAIANPAVRLELTHLQERAVDKLGWGLGLAWDPPQPEVRGARVAAARAHSDEVEHEIGEREWMLASDVRTAHAELAAVDEEARLAAEAAAVRGKLRGLVQDLLRGGGATRFDLDLAALAEAEAERVQAQKARERRAAEGKLLGLLGLRPDISLRVGTLEIEVAPGADSRAVCSGLEERALEARPALAAAAARHRAAEQTLRQQVAARWPWIRLSAIPRVRRNEIFGQTTDVVVGVDVTIPLLDFNTGPIRAAEASRDRARAEWLATLDGVRRDIAVNCALRSDEARLLELHRERLTPVLQEHDRLMAQALAAHQVDLGALVLAEQRVLEDRFELVRAKLGFRLASIALDRAVGARLGR